MTNKTDMLDNFLFFQKIQILANMTVKFLVLRTPGDGPGSQILKMVEVPGIEHIE